MAKKHKKSMNKHLSQSVFVPHVKPPGSRPIITPAPAPAVKKVEWPALMFLSKSDQADDPLTIDALTALSAWTAPKKRINGVALRTGWDRVGDNTRYWDFLDAGVALGKLHDKKISILVTAGVTTPASVCALDDAACFLVTEQAGTPPKISDMGVPWNPTWQSRFGPFVKEFGARYNGKLAYVVMGGPGRRAESFFVFTDANISTFNAMGGLPKWEQGVKWIIDQYALAFPNTPFILDLGSPIPGAAGAASLQAVCDYGFSKYRGRFWTKSDGLSIGGPPNNSIGAKEIGVTGGGYQFGLPIGEDGDIVTLMRDVLNRGIGFGARLIEVYKEDCENELQWPNLEAANATMLK